MEGQARPILEPPPVPLHSPEGVWKRTWWISDGFGALCCFLRPGHILFCPQPHLGILAAQHLMQLAVSQVPEKDPTSLRKVQVSSKALPESGKNLNRPEFFLGLNPGEGGRVFPGWHRHPVHHKYGSQYGLGSIFVILTNNNRVLVATGKERVWHPTKSTSQVVQAYQETLSELSLLLPGSPLPGHPSLHASL